VKIDSLLQKVRDSGLDDESRAMVLDMAPELLEVYQAAQNWYDSGKAFKRAKVPSAHVALAKKALEKIFRDKEKS
jgi:hypothetical protein